MLDQSLRTQTQRGMAVSKLLYVFLSAVWHVYSDVAPEMLLRSTIKALPEAVARYTIDEVINNNEGVSC